MEPFTDYEKIVKRTSDMIATMRYTFGGCILESLEKQFAQIIADETYIQEVKE